MVVNENICGLYPELLDKTQKILDLGVTRTAFCKLCGENTTNGGIYKWIMGNRPLNHSKAPLVERAINEFKARAAEI